MIRHIFTHAIAHKMKIGGFLLAAICVVLLSVEGCSNGARQLPLKRVSVAFQSWVGYGPLYLADEKGFFKDEGIEVIFVDEQLDAERRDALRTGMLDCEAGTLDLLVNKRAQGVPVVALFDLDFSYGADAIVAAKDIITLNDLRGKKIAFARDDVSDTLISYVFSKNSVSLDAATIVNVSPENAAMPFLEGTVDAVVTWEPLVTKALGRPGAHILLSTKDEPEIIIDTFNIRKEIVDDDPALAKGIMRAWFRALAYYESSPVEASSVIAAHYNVSPEEYRTQVKGLKWVAYRDQVSDARLAKRCEVFNAIATMKMRNARIVNTPDARSAINQQLLRELYENSQ